MATETMTGKCLCGSVKIDATVQDARVEACHCSMCRNWGGGPLYALGGACEVAFDGEEHVRRYTSSEWAERGFCGNCGTHLFYRLTEGEGFYAMPAGLFEQTHAMTLHSEIFVDEKPAYLDGAAEQLTGAEMKAQYGFD